MNSFPSSDAVVVTIIVLSPEVKNSSMTSAVVISHNGSITVMPSGFSASSRYFLTSCRNMSPKMEQNTGSKQMKG